jgi:hypothetical protein
MSQFFIDQKEPEDKIPFVTLKEQHWLWDGEGWLEMNVRYSETHPGQVRDEIRTVAKEKKQNGNK